MPRDYSIYVDGRRPADLRHSGVTVRCATLQEAAIEWGGLSRSEQMRASIKVIDPIRIFDSTEIRRLHYGPRPVGV